MHVVPKEGRAGGNAPALTGEPLASATARAYRAARAAPREASSSMHVKATSSSRQRARPGNEHASSQPIRVCLRHYVAPY